MKNIDPAEIIVFAVLGVVALLIVGSLGTGVGSYLYLLSVPNTSSAPVSTISGTVLPILFMVALVIGFVYYIKKDG